MIGKIFRELSVNSSDAQRPMVDALLEEAPVMAGLPMMASTHGLFNVYEELLETGSAGAVDLDEALPEVATESKLQQVDLKVLGAIMTVGEDKAKKYGGAAKYFANNYGPVLKKTGSDMEKALVYNTFRAAAIANHSAGDPRLINAGGSGNANFSAVAVHYAPNEVVGLYDPTGFGNGKVFDISMINDGALYLDKNGRLVYGVRLKSYFGVQVANKRYVSAIVNADYASGTPKPVTAMMMDSLIENCRGRPENTIIYMHPSLLTKLQDLKGGLMQVTERTKDIDRTFLSWNGVEIVTTYNMLRGTEATVAVA